jgi:phosphoglycerate-specific signal transduction histidine kinase
MASFTAFKRMSLRQRFLVAPLLGLTLLCLLVAGFIYESRHQSALLTHVVEEDLVAFERYANVFVELSQQHVALVELLNAAPKSDEATLYDSAKSRLHAIQEATRKLKEALPGAQERKKALGY